PMTGSWRLAAAEKPRVGQASGSLEDARRQLGAILAADGSVWKKLGEEVGGLEEELRQLREVTDQFQRQSRCERDEFDQLELQRQQFSADFEQDSNLQSLVPRTNVLSIRPQ
ncbi:unnamed protein product, partial [Polarella glacialis]